MMSANDRPAAQGGAGPRASIVISSKDRLDELRKALASALTQGPDVEVLVVDDGSSDGTAETVRRDYPGARLVRLDPNRGMAEARNIGVQEARAPIVFIIDDDAVMTSPETTRQTLAEFDHPRIGAVAIPYVDVLYDETVHQRPPDHDRFWIATYARGTAQAFRRDVFLELGGFHAFYGRQGEETEYYFRMLGAGYVVRLGTADPIMHNESPNRVPTVIERLAVRNRLLMIWQDAPMPWALLHGAMLGLNAFRHALRVRRPGPVKGYWDGLRMFAHRDAVRRPMTRSAYRAFLRMRKRGCVRFGEVERLLPPVPPQGAGAPEGAS